MGLSPSRRRLVLLVVIAVLVPVTCVSLALSTVTIPHFFRIHAQSDVEQAVGEVRANLHILCTDVANYHGRTGQWLAAGPVPKLIPDARAPFVVDRAFEQLGFAPRAVEFQYQVIVDKPPATFGVRCVARGRVRPGGPILEATLPAFANEKLGDLTWSSEPQ